MKRIISLLLAICMMASLTVVAFAEETASFVDVDDIVEFYRIGQTITDDVVTAQTVTYYNLSTMGTSSAILSGNYKNRWVLFRVPIGEGWDLTSLTFSGRAQADKGSITYVRLMLSSKADYDTAVAASGSNIAAEDFLPRPYDATENVIIGTVDRTKSSSKGYQTIQNIEPLTDATALANSYDGQYLYLALAADGAQAQTLRKNYPLTFTITGEKRTTFADATSSVAVAGNTATVTTDAQAGTAKLIAASYNGDEMADVIVATVDAADAESLSVDISGLTGATKKVFLWANDMITPLADAVSL